MALTLLQTKPDPFLRFFRATSLEYFLEPCRSRAHAGRGSLPVPRSRGSRGQVVGSRESGGRAICRDRSTEVGCVGEAMSDERGAYIRTIRLPFFIN